MKIVSVLFALACAANAARVPAFCVINVRDLTDTTPLVLMADGLEFRLPDGINPHQIRVWEKQAIRLVCPGVDTTNTPPQQNTITVLSPQNTFTDLGTPDILIHCTEKRDFYYVHRARNIYCNYNEFKCKSNLVDVAKNNNCNAEKGTLLEIGYPLGHGLVKTIDICFDDKDKITLWSRHVLVAGKYRRQPPTDPKTNPTFKKDRFYDDIKPDDPYSEAEESETIGAIFKDHEPLNNWPYITAKNYLECVPLTPNADFAYKNQGDTAFRWINAAPMWSTIRAGNWKNVETKLRDFADGLAQDKELVVYTGTHGVLTLPDSSMNQKEIWLSTNKNAIPAPKLFWKVVYDQKSERAVAIVVVNNPFIKAKVPGNSYLLCKGNEVTVSWLNLAQPTNKQLGYTYCCRVNDAFRKNIKSLPGFNVGWLLD